MATPVRKLLNSEATERDLLWTLLVLTGGNAVKIKKCPFQYTGRDLLYTLLQSGAVGGVGGVGTTVPDGVYTVGLGISNDGKLTVAGGKITNIQQAQP